ncbi:glutaredoxin, GrxA family [Aggregatibacter actinomycetemcomitans serotype e str. SC1083]|uniref:Glutaredoxin, GrxA family n=1 Tax=Aggregatibacter actinomycetemcomitans serotype e str. SC1083 TaxID=907488 RepID=G4AAJ9_AGGAC|nr:GrxA family glutaredoxin [Aggregatibacter actinomycetemcomitans]EGY32856.1 glutaredoxin, GrxA family [Aggregatibacter actinomycetemcomitans serotype e str. SC1083]KYK75959.1 glutaredoxin [Aggregatibacter actinomycetemcomitans serotype e str. SA3096]KYK82096.1 glutaredoxin [Aggregatibacter actinomycetemcomitans serotype e str. SC936]KYK96050.1 glutaredoxin [Aggregatibacter actinomycetemcomitans serotype e str. ANH9776]TYB21878.1 GrxA family glutaredoxin [Aggregatibacter actinomycetemcomitans
MFVTIYGRLSCPYCVRAKTLAEKLKNAVENFDYRYIDTIEQGMSKEDIAKIIGKPVQTVPQILIDDNPIGGCTDFEALMNEQFGDID